MREDGPSISCPRLFSSVVSCSVMAAQHQFASVVCIFARLALYLSTVRRARGVLVSEFYPFGAAAGDQMLDRNNDGSSQEIVLAAPFVLFGQEMDKLFVSTNGALSFGERLQSYSGEHLSVVNTALVAPFWADVDTREIGEVFYRQTNESSCITDVVNILREVFEDAVGFTPFTLFIATWNNVGYYNRNRDRTNTFQCVLATDWTRSYVILLYADLQWATADSCSGSSSSSSGSGSVSGNDEGCSLHANPAQAGFSTGDGTRYFTVNGSGTDAVLSLNSTSNVGQPGVWIFQVDGDQVLSAAGMRCPTLSNPANGHVSYTSGTTFGLTATYSCNTGYNLSGNSIRTCQATRMWSGSAHTCHPVDCGSLPNPVNGQVSHSVGTTFGLTATYNCNTGYNLTGNRTRICQATRLWSGSAPTCPPVDCGSLPNPANGQVSHSVGTTFGLAATYSCNTGYNLVGDRTRMCQATRMWSGSAPTCHPVDCDSLPNPANGQVSHSVGTTFGLTATYNCNTGYNLTGNRTRICQATRLWSGSAPTCPPVDCGSLPNPANGQVSHSVGTTFGSAATYSCNTGYNLVGDRTRMCQATRMWSGSAPTCHPVDCGSLPNPANGQVSHSVGTTFGLTATYNCNTGYNLTGNRTRICQATRLWSGSAPTCPPVDCGSLPNPANGQVSHSVGTTFGSAATYSCNTGYNLVGDRTRMCQATRVWSESAPTCHPVDCGSLPNPANGQVSHSVGTTFGLTATYNCNTGYNLTGNRTRICQATRLWSGSAPTCPPVDCGSLPNPANGQVSHSVGTTFGSAATYSCNTGYNLVGDRTRMCQATRMWSGSAPTCHPVDCGSLPNPANGQVSHSVGTTFGLTATYNCNTGYNLTGNRTRICQATRLWSGSAPTCPPVDCGSLPNPANGQVSHSVGTTFGSAATYSCNTGYNLVGDRTRMCQATRMWSGSAPTCHPVDCGSLPNPANGQVSHSVGTTFGLTATYNCNTGYNLTGNRTRICQATRLWSGSAPTCPPVDCGSLPNPANGQVSHSVGTTFGSAATYSCNTGYNLVGDRTRMCQATRVWSESAPTCHPVDCGSLPNPANGQVSHSVGTTFGLTATYNCNTGYNLTGNRTRICQATRLWSGSAPTCPPVDCGSLPNPANGQVSHSVGTTFGSAATYSCNTGYNLVGDRTRMCQATRMWSGSAPTCHPVDCGSLPNPANGQVSHSVGTTFGLTATYSCNTGYNLVGDSTRTCQATRLWSGSAPTCQNINECDRDEFNNCDENAQCTDMDGSYNCSCNFGYSGNGYTCTDINECQLGTDLCVNAKCYNTAGSYTCTCLPGFIPQNLTTCNCTNGDIRLMNGTEPSVTEGRVEICYNNAYGSVCDDRWDIVDAGVVCRQLGFNISEGSVALGGAYFGSGSGDILLDNVVCRGTESSLLECNINTIGQHNCDHSEDAGVRCEAMCTEGSVRLLVDDGTTYYMNQNTYPDYYFIKDELARGRVEVCMNGTYGTVCDDSWDNQDASVVCRQLGFSPYGAIAITSGTFSDPSQSPTVNGVQCTGSETDLLSCTHSNFIDSSSCRTHDDAGVVCQAISTPNGNCSDGELRMGGGRVNLRKRTREGRVEICINNAWGTVCDNPFRSPDAAVVCRRLGLLDLQGVVVYPAAHFGVKSGPIFLDQLQCSGSEQSLLDCPTFTDVGLHSCDHSVDASVKCQDVNECETGEALCDPNADCKDILTSYSCQCRQGFEGNGFNCTDVNECTRNISGCEDTCENTEGSYFCVCNRGLVLAADNHNCTACTPGSVRLMGGSGNHTGRVEVCVSGTESYGTVCNDHWDVLEARVVCTQLGFSSEGAIPISDTRFGRGDGLLILLDDMACNGSETSLTECANAGVHIHDCDHSEDAGVICEAVGSCIDGSVRLIVGEDYEYYYGETNYDDVYYIKDQLARGRVELCVGGRYGTVCDDSWDDQDASVVCRQLGFSPYGAIALSGNAFGERESKFLLSSVGCTGLESNLLNCSKGTNVCDSPFRDAGVICQAISTPEGNCSDGDIRVVNGSSQAGRVEICINSAWGTVCDRLFGAHDAAVACAKLGGFNRNTALVVRGEFGSGSGPIFLNRLICNGTESSLLDCNGLRTTVNLCNHTEDVAISCEDIDECSTNNAGCEQICSNTIGTFECYCNSGYMLEENRLNCSDIDECMENTHNCHHNATCINTDGGYNCSCNPGYTMDGTNCTNINECELETYPCHFNANCVDTDGSFNCTCREGFEGNGVNCTDIPECGREIDDCDSNATCTNTVGSYVCNCNAGFTGDGFTCIEINECYTVNGGCEQICTNAIGSFACSCGTGYLLDGNGFNCTDINECESDDFNNCHENAQCINTEGSFTCSCNPGYTGDGVNCTNMNECELEIHTCSSNAHCADTDGSFNCICREGFEGDGFNCTDISECDRGLNECDPNANCTNTIGSYECMCYVGLIGNGFTCADLDECVTELDNCHENATCNNTFGCFECTCNAGFEGDGVNCTNINECELETYPCNSNANCTDTEGSFNCTCREGFEGNGFNCTDILECERGLDDCDPNANCKNAFGSYDCNCKTGFTGDGFTCRDIDECVTEIDNCHENATCNNTFGSFECTCNVGFEGDGVNCTNINECELETDNCHMYADCTDIIGSFECTCSSGFEGDGVKCTNVNECESDSVNRCNRNARCIDTIGNYNCSCNSGYKGDGFNCTDINECQLGTDFCVNAECNNTAGSYICRPCFPGFIPGNLTTCTCTNGDIRLMNDKEPSVMEGRVEICYNNAYGSICDDFWDIVDASVVCRQLGLNRSKGSVALGGAYFGSGGGDILLDNVVCRGTESSLLECNTNPIGQHNCDHSEDAGVRCEAMCTEGSVRLLVGDDTTYYLHQNTYPDYYFIKDELARGRVEVCVNGTYGTVCDDSWDNQDASVVCTQLGFSPFGAVASAIFSDSSQSPTVSGVQCTGSETDLLSCSHSSRIENCGLNDDAGVVCQNASTPAGNCTDETLRLVGGTNPAEGRIEICINNAWGTICDTGFTKEEALVACRQLGKLQIEDGAEVFIGSQFGGGTGPIFLNYLGCSGTESSLMDCNQFAGDSCDHSQDAGVRCVDVDECATNNGRCDHYCTNTIGSFVCSCYPGYTLDGDRHTCKDLDACSMQGAVRLVNGSNATEGGVEVCNGTRYGTVCDDHWDELDARVVCRQLGYSGEAAALKRAFFGSSLSRPIHLDNVRCNGSEPSLLNCIANEVGMNNCDHSEDAGVRCNASCIEGSVRLMVGEDYEYYYGETLHDDVYYIKDQLARGRVELCVGGRYGTVCDDSWDHQDASVVCRQLGLSPFGAIAVTTGSFRFSETSLPHLLSDVICQGSETNLLQCQYSTTVSCGVTEDAAAVCQVISTPAGNCSNGELRLEGSSDDTQANTREGRVEICINNAWGTICATLFGSKEAEVVCGQLEGFQVDGASAVSGFGPGSGPIFMDKLHCSGIEASLLECRRFTPLGLTTCEHREVAGVRCNDINECSTSNGGCEQICTNAIGSFACNCTVGYLLDGNGFNCTDIDECENEEDNCHENANCTNTKGSYTCSCNLGYTGDGVNCTNINECELEIHTCSSNANCTDTVGSFNCTCREGFEGDGFNCKDIPECERGLDNCDPNATCINTFGSYDCLCNTGFTGDGFICSDINECEVKVDNCHENATCNNTFGSFECTCIAGFEGDGVDCTNIHECNLKTDNCHENATCTDTTGSFECTCNAGFEGDGVNCTNINECARETDECDMNANCTDNIGSYDCSCNTGYLGDGFTCEDINECNETNPMHNCDINANCNNTDGSFTCTCHRGYTGDGVTCSCANGDVLLVNGSVASEGRVEICYNNTYGTVCDDHWDKLDAQVICAQVGFTSNDSLPLHGAFFGCSSRPIFLDNVVCRGTESSLLECSTNRIGQHNCDHSEDAGVRCNANCIDGTVRLMVGEDYDFYRGETDYDTTYYIGDDLSRGRVEICKGGGYHTVCVDSWDERDASVVCKELGFSPNGATAIGGGFFSTSELTPAITRVECTGSETSLDDCPSIPTASCSSSNDAAVVCQNAPFANCTHGELRLVGGAVPHLEGRVEICINNAWGTVCDKKFSSEDAQVVCRQLHLPTEGAIAHRGPTQYGLGLGPVFLDELGCTGKEDDIISCEHRPLGFPNTDCTHSDDAGVECPDTNECEGPDQFCAVNATCINTRGSYTCLCKPGFEGDGFHSCSDINECLANNGSCHSCSNTDGSYECYCNSGFRIVEYDDGVTKTCIDVNECTERMMPCGENAQCVNLEGSYHCFCLEGYEGNATIQCENIDECAEGKHNCSASAYCNDTIGGFLCTCQYGYIGDGHSCNCTNGQVRLMNGTAPADGQKEGRVEICYNNIYGTVCNDFWDELDAVVVCRQLGFNGSDHVALKNGAEFFGSGLDLIWLDNSICNGDESSLLECNTNQIGQHNCDHSEDAGLRCNALCVEGSVRLLPTALPEQYYRNPTQYALIKDELRLGRVEVCVGGRYGTVCDNYWDNQGASVVCRQLGFSPYGAIAGSEAVFGEPTLPVVLSLVNCTGLEERLVDCPSSNDTECGQFDDADVVCQAPDTPFANCTDGDVRLIRQGEVTAFEGRVEVCINNAWGTICNKKKFFDKLDAQVVCGQLGFKQTSNHIVKSYEAGTGPIYLSQLSCHGSEATLLECGTFARATAIHDCDHNDDVGVFCQAKCLVEEEVSSFYGTYLWPGNVETGVTIQTNCSYSCGTLTGGVATRYCGERGAWNPTNFDECPTRVTCDLVDIADQTISPDTVDEVTGQLKNIINGSGTEDQSSRNLDVVATTFAKLANLSHDVNIEEATNVLETLNTLQSWNPEILGRESSQMVNSVERLLARLVQNEDVANLHVSTPNLAFAGERVDLQNAQTSGRKFTSTSGENGMVAGSIGSDGEQITNDSVSLSLPGSLFNGAGDVSLSFTAYSTAALFPLATDPSRNDRFELGSSVIGASVTGRDVRRLSNNVTIRLLMRHENFEVPRCMYWDFDAEGRGGWSSEGCSFTSRSQRIVTCTCNHLTNFGVLANMNPVVCNGNTQDPSDDFTECIARNPDVQIVVDTSISRSSAYEVDQNKYSVGIGHEFGLNCNTFTFFEVSWYHRDMNVAEVSSTGMAVPLSFSYIEQPGQLYAYRISQSEVILRTRHTGPVGIQSVADGMYKCVARNLDKTNNNTVSVQTKVFTSINGTLYVRFNSNPEEDIQRNFSFPSTDFVPTYFSTQILNAARNHGGKSSAMCYEVPRRLHERGARLDRIECNITSEVPFSDAIMTDVRSAMALTTHSPIVSAVGFCDAEVDINTPHGVYNWSEMEVGINATNKCVYNTTEQFGLARRRCASARQWDNYYGDQCITETTYRIQMLGEQPITADNVDMIVNELSNIVNVISDPADQSTKNLEVIATVFSSTTSLIAGGNISVSNSFVENIVEIVDGVTDWPGSVLEQQSSGIVRSFERIGENFVDQENFTNITIQEESLVFRGERSDRDTLQEYGATFDLNDLLQTQLPPEKLQSASGLGKLVSSGSDNSEGNSSDGQSGSDNSLLLLASNISVQLPAEVFANVTEDSVGLLYTLYLTSSLFPIAPDSRNETFKNVTVATPVVGAAVSGRNISNLASPVVITLPITSTENFNWSACVTWNFSAGERGNWSEAGCVVAEYDEESGLVVCECNHLTNFALLVAIQPRIGSLPPNHPGLTILTYIGASLSMVGLILTAIVLVGSKKMRQRDVTKFHFQFAIAMFCLLLIFMIGIDRNENEIVCTAMSALIHYFTLATVFWMGAEAVLMFQKLIIVFGEITVKYFMTVSLICWLSPLLAVVPALATLGTGRNMLIFVNETVEGERELRACFISDPIVFFVTLFGPIFLVFAFNFVIFLLGVRVVVTQSRKKKISVKSAIKSMITIVGLMVIFGLTWLFGALTVRGASTVAQYLFVIFNGFQGFFFFVSICLIGKDGRKFCTYLLTMSLRSKNKKSSTSGTNNLQEKAGITSPRYTVLTGSNFNKGQDLKLDGHLHNKTEIKMNTSIPNQVATSDNILIKGSLPKTLGLEEIGTGMESEMEMESELEIERSVMMANEDAANMMQGGENRNMKTNVTHSEGTGEAQRDVMGGEMQRDMEANVMQDRVSGHDMDPANISEGEVNQHDTEASVGQNEVNIFEQKLKEFEELQFTPLCEKGNENSTG